jgi:hypothetical protein
MAIGGSDLQDVVVTLVIICVWREIGLSIYLCR